MQGGIHHKTSKFLTADAQIEKLDKVAVVSVSMAQHIGAPAVVCVKAGDTVKQGQMIGKAEGNISANIFASISGKVESIGIQKDIAFKDTTVVRIKNDFKNKQAKLTVLINPTREQIKKRVFDAGIVGLGGAGFPSHIKLNPADPVDTLILNGAECEDYLTCDDFLMRTKAAEVLKGGSYLAKALGLTSFKVAVEDNKPEAIAALNAAKEKIDGYGIEIIPIKAVYPHGYEKIIVKTVTKREVPLGKLPSVVGVVMFNVSTAFATYEAIELGKPLYERLITVSGRAVQTPRNFIVPVGCDVKTILLAAGGEKLPKEEIMKFENFCSESFDNENEAYFAIDKAKKIYLEKKESILKENKPDAKSELKEAKINYKLEVKAQKINLKDIRKKLIFAIKEMREKFEWVMAKVVAGGSFMGDAQENLEASVNKTTSGILFLTKNEVSLEPVSPCINCGKCKRVCPMRLMPMVYDEASIAGDYQTCVKYNIAACIECGCCAFVCPSSRQIVQSVRAAKAVIKQGGASRVKEL